MFDTLIHAVDEEADLSSLILLLTQRVFERVSPGLVSDDKLVLAIRLVQILLLSRGFEFNEAEAALLFRGAGGSSVDADATAAALIRSTFVGDAALPSSQAKVNLYFCICIGAQCSVVLLGEKWENKDGVRMNAVAT